MPVFGLTGFGLALGLGALVAAERALHRIPNAAEEHCTAEVLERDERVVNAQQDRGQL